MEVTIQIYQIPARDFSREVVVSQATLAPANAVDANFVVAQTGGPDEGEAVIVGIGQSELEAYLPVYSQVNTFTASFTVDQDRIGQIYSGRLLHYLPAEFEVQDFGDDLREYLEVVAVSADEFYDFIDKFTDIFDPDRCEPKYLVYLAKLIGYPLSARGFDSPIVSVKEAAIRRARTQLKQAVEVYKRKGLKEAFQILFYSLGYYIELVELWTNSYMTFLPEVPAGQTLYHPTKNPNGWYKSPYFGIRLFQVTQSATTVCIPADSPLGQNGGWSGDDLAEVMEAIHQIRPVHTVLWWLEYFFDLCENYTFTDFDFSITAEAGFTDRFFDCEPDEPIYYRDDERLLGVTRNGTDSLAITHNRDPQEGFCDADVDFSVEIGDLVWNDRYCADVNRGAGEMYRDGSNFHPRNGIQPHRDPTAFEGRNGGRKADLPLAEYYAPPTITDATGSGGTDYYKYYVVAYYPGGFQTVAEAEVAYGSTLAGLFDVPNTLEWLPITGVTTFEVYRTHNNLTSYLGSTTATYWIDDFTGVGSPIEIPEPIMSSLVYDRGGCYGPAYDKMDVLYQIGEEAEDGVVAYYNQTEFNNWLDTIGIGPGPSPEILGRDSGNVPKLQASIQATDVRSVHSNAMVKVGNDIYSLFGKDASGDLTRTITRMTFSGGNFVSSNLITPVTSQRFCDGVAGVYNNKIYYLFGSVASEGEPSLEGWSWTAQIFDPLNNTLTVGFDTVINVIRLTRAASAQVGTKLYTFGGVDDGADYSNCIKIDLSTGNQNSIPQPFGHVRDMAAVAINEYIYLFGGSVDDVTPLSTLYRFDTITEQFTTISEAPAGTTKPIMFAKQSSIYILSATNWSTGADKSTVGLEYHTDSNSWTEVIVTDQTSTTPRKKLIEHTGKAYGAGSVVGTANTQIQVITVL